LLFIFQTQCGFEQLRCRYLREVPAMATKKQIAANRANAKLSTGPKTAAGRFKSSRNAFRHGLTAQFQLDPTVTERVDAMARLLVGVSDNAEQQLAATEWSQAQLELLRVRAVRAKILTEVDLASRPELQGLAALDRYERCAHAKRRKASKVLWRRN
jgi:hypothetical protein